MIKKITIKNLQGIQTHGATSDQFNSLAEFEAWIEATKQSGAWGKPAGFYPISQLSQEELAQEISRQTLDAEGNPLLEPLVEIPQQFEVVIENISLAVAQEQINQEALAYLASTDWMAIREYEGGTPMLPAIKAERAAARARIIR